MWRPSLPEKSRRNTVLVLLLSAAIQLGLLAWSQYVDAHPESFGGLRYTDVDWRVVYDGIVAMSRPKSSPATGPLAPVLAEAGLGIGTPYARATFRYTPLLALLLSPSLIAPILGRLLLVAFTLAVSLVLDSEVDTPGWRKLHALWTLNPVVLNISTRGSPEAVPCLLTCGLLLSLRRAGLSRPERPTPNVTVRKAGKIIDTETVAEIEEKKSQQRWQDAAAVALALAASYKIYPVIYVPSIWCALARKHGGWFALPIWRFGVVAAVTAVLLNGALYAVWGDEFLDHTFLYHLTRLDHRHNFSIYFLPIYLSQTSPPNPLLPSSLPSHLLSALRHPLVSFLPQFTLITLTGLTLPSSYPLELTLFLQTSQFIAFNKVCTSQYFLWPLPFIPLISFPSLSWRRLAMVVAAWVGAQAVWLNYAYRLEFLGQPTYLQLWGAGAGLLGVSAWGLGQLVLGAAPVGVARTPIKGSPLKRLKVE